MMGMYEEFNVLDDFKLSGMPILDYSNAFVINAENDKFSDLESMIAYMKDHPGEVSFATETGSFTHLHVLALEAAAGVSFNLVDAEENKIKLRGEFIKSQKIYGFIVFSHTFIFYCFCYF